MTMRSFLVAWWLTRTWSFLQPVARPPTWPRRVQPRSETRTLAVSSETTPEWKKKAFLAAGVATSLAWTTCAIQTLSWHPNPVTHAACGVRHNALTIAQALAFPLPLAWGVFGTLGSRRLETAVGFASLWLAAAVLWMPAFAYGYSMYSASQRVFLTAAHLGTALLCLSRSLRPQRTLRGLLKGGMACVGVDSKKDDGRIEYAVAALLFAWFAVLPVVSPFPRATVPTLLGKRLSRAASAWTWLAAVACYDLKEAIEEQRDTSRLRTGLAVGSAAHLGLVAAKIAGVDGGGLLLPGTGLSRFYANAFAVPFTFGSSLLMHLSVLLAVTAPHRPDRRRRD